MRLILVINIPAAVGLMVLAAPIIRLLFQRGAFGPGDTAMMQPVLVVFAVGLPFFSFVNIVLRAFYAQKDTTTPVQAALLSFGVNLVLSLVLMKPLGTVGLALAGNVAVVVQAVYLQVSLARKRDGLEFRHVAVDLIKIIAASAAMGAVVAAGWWAWSRSISASTLSDAGALGALIGAGVAVYGGVVWALRIEGRDDLRAVISKLRGRLA
jgi:putative peptidoglycan lipid II flippase